MHLLPEVEDLSAAELLKYITKRAKKIVKACPADDEAWDNPEEWSVEAAELAHAIMRLARDNNWKFIH